MKFLHLGDLHLGKTLSDFDLIEDQRYILDRILHIAEKESIDGMRAAGYEVVIVSTRCAHVGGLGAINEWLTKYGITVDSVRTEKPPAICYIDDRAICFDGHPETLLEKVQNFKPWNKE